MMSSSKMWALHRLKMPVLERRPILAEVKCLNEGVIFILAVFVSVFLVSLILLRQTADAFDILPYLIVAGILLIVFAVFYKPIIGLEEKGVFVMTKRGPNEVFLPFSRISRMSVTGRCVKIVLKDSPLYLGRYWYFVCLGDMRAFRGELDRLRSTIPMPAAKSSA